MITMDEIDPNRRIMDRIGEDTYLPYVKIREADAAVLVGLPVTGLFTGVVLPPEQWGTAGAFAGLLVGLLLGVATVQATPSHLTAPVWLRDVIRHVGRRPDRTLHGSRDSDAATTDGGLATTLPVRIDESTQDLTGIERAWPGAGAIERQDGTMEAFIEVTPANRDFAMSGDWADAQGVAHEFANSDLEFDLTFYATTRSFPAERMVATIEDRLSDPDVESNPVLQTLLEEYRDLRPERLADVHELRYYIGVEVDRLAVYHDHESEPTPVERLAELPFVGWLANPFVTRREDLTELELRERMVDRLWERLRTIDRELVREIDGWSARRLTTLELVTMAMDFWNGTDYSQRSDPDQLLADLPLASHQSRTPADGIDVSPQYSGGDG